MLLNFCNGFIGAFLFSISLLLFLKLNNMKKLSKKRVLYFMVVATGSLSIIEMNISYLTIKMCLVYLITAVLLRYIFRFEWSLSLITITISLAFLLIARSVSYFYLCVGLGYGSEVILSQGNLLLAAKFIETIVLLCLIFLLPLFRRKSKAKIFSQFKINKFVILYLLSLLFSYICFGILTSKDFSEHRFSAFIIFPVGLLFLLSNFVLFLALHIIVEKNGQNLSLKNQYNKIAQLNKELDIKLQRGKRIEEKLKYYATTDRMTGAMNKEAGLAFLEEYMEQTNATRKPLTVCYLDINNLKQVNDTYGHKEGDHLIITITGCIKSHLREEFIFSRLGGDEFVLIFPKTSIEEGERLWLKIKGELDRHNEEDEKPYPYHVSHGFAQYWWDSKLSPQQLIAIADAEMYKDKQNYKKKNSLTNV